VLSPLVRVQPRRSLRRARDLRYPYRRPAWLLRISHL